MTRRTAWVPEVMCGLLALFGCAEPSILMPNGHIQGWFASEIIRPPGMSDAEFVAQYRDCQRTEGPHGFPDQCMQGKGSSILSSNGTIHGPTMAENTKWRMSICRNFSTEFTQPEEAYIQCMSRLGETVTLANGQVIPPYSAFRTPLVVKPDGAAAVAIAKAPPTPAAKQIISSGNGSTATSADTSSALQLLMSMALAAKASGGATHAAPATSSSNGPDPIGGMMSNYGTCGNMWGCW